MVPYRTIGMIEGPGPDLEDALYAASALIWSLIIPSTPGSTSWSATSARSRCWPS